VVLFPTKSLFQFSETFLAFNIMVILTCRFLQFFIEAFLLYCKRDIFGYAFARRMKIIEVIKEDRKWFELFFSCYLANGKSITLNILICIHSFDKVWIMRFDRGASFWACSYTFTWRERYTRVMISLTISEIELLPTILVASVFIFTCCWYYILQTLLDIF
jgi:hypothetical protein